MAGPCCRAVSVSRWLVLQCRHSFEWPSIHLLVVHVLKGPNPSYHDRRQVTTSDSGGDEHAQRQVATEHNSQPFRKPRHERHHHLHQLDHSHQTLSWPSGSELRGRTSIYWSIARRRPAAECVRRYTRLMVLWCSVRVCTRHSSQPVAYHFAWLSGDSVGFGS
jgi:hypothetical protein